MPHHSPRVVDTDNHEIPQGQTHQSYIPVTTEIPDDNKPEYRGPRLHSQIHPQTIQPTVEILNQGVQMPPLYPGASSVVALPLAYFRAPYALHGGQYGQTVGQMANLGMVCPPQMYPQFSSQPMLAQTTSQAFQIPNHQTNLQPSIQISLGTNQNKPVDYQM